MEYISKSYRLDEEVIAQLERLKSDYGSVNKGLREVLFAFQAIRHLRQKMEAPAPDINVEPHDDRKRELEHRVAELERSK